MDWGLFTFSVMFAFMAGLGSHTIADTRSTPKMRLYAVFYTLISWAISLFLLIGAMGFAFDLVGSKS